MVEIREKLIELLDLKFSEEGNSSFFLVDITCTDKDKIQVFIDKDGGLKLEDCVGISRYLEKNIEENNWLSENYSLDVSSPGVGAVLKLKRQYQNNIGRLLSLETNQNSSEIKGKLIGVEDSYISVETVERVLVEEGKKKKKEITVQKEIAFDDIKKAVVKIAF
jgi:ribosome maturation factor RimP